MQYVEALLMIGTTKFEFLFHLCSVWVLSPESHLGVTTLPPCSLYMFSMVRLLLLLKQVLLFLHVFVYKKTLVVKH